MIKWQNKPSFGKTATIGTVELDLDPVRGTQKEYKLYITEIGSQANSGYHKPYRIVADNIDKAEQEASRIVIAYLLQKVDKYTKLIKHYENIINIVKDK